MRGIAGNRRTALTIRLHNQPAADPAIGTGGAHRWPTLRGYAHRCLKYVLLATTILARPRENLGRAENRNLVASTFKPRANLK